MLEMRPPDPPSEEEDPDRDGAATYWDNCPATWNPDQKDSNGDNLGDACTDPDERRPIVCIDTPVSPSLRGRLVVEISLRAHARKGSPIMDVRYIADGAVIGTAKPVPVPSNLNWVAKGAVESLFIWIRPSAGRHLLQAVAVTADGVEVRSEAVYVVVSKHIAGE